MLMTVETQRLGAEPALAVSVDRDAIMPDGSSGLLCGPAQLRHREASAYLAGEDIRWAVVADVLTAPDEDFRKAAADVVRKFEELYRRLA
jgi:hypothetical protein